jgi:hypothetical protein
MTGKWSLPGVPHKGWVCTGIDDLEDDTAICEMCEVQEIRFVHYMEHADYPDTLACGCVCAGHMEQDLEGAREREGLVRRAAGRKGRWLTRQWRLSRNGNPFLNARDYNVTVFPKGSAWSFRVLNRTTDDVLLARRDYPTQDAAKLRAFDAMEWMRSRGR